MKTTLLPPAALALFVTAIVPLGAAAQESTIRSNLAARIPALQQIDEIRATPMPGLYEVRVGSNLLYTDRNGDFLIRGPLQDTRTQKNLTQERIDKLTAIAFDQLPLQDAFAVTYGKGTRKMAAFEDPNCPYCKKFEQELAKLDDVTVYTFLIPILGADSTRKSRQIWCNKDRSAAWLDWMLKGQPPSGEGDCDTSALERNLAFAGKYRINGTPTLIFADGTRVPGLIEAADIDQMLDP